MEDDHSPILDQPRPVPPTATLVDETFIIDKLPADSSTQTRAALNVEAVESYAELMQAQGAAAMPPIVVYQDEAGQCLLADGFHRVEAAKKIHWTTVRAEVRRGSRLDALTHGLRANLAHGVRRTNADKRRSVEIVLAEEALRGNSDNSLANLCGVSNHLVAEVRRGLTNDGELQVGNSPTSDGLAKRKGEDSKYYPIRKRRKEKAKAHVQSVVDPSLTHEQAGGKKNENVYISTEGKISDTVVGTELTSSVVADDEDQSQVEPPSGASQKHGQSSAIANTNMAAEPAPSTPPLSSADHDDARWDDGVLSADEIRTRLELIPQTHRYPSTAEQKALQDCFLEIARTVNRLAETVCVARSVRTEIVLDAAKIVGNYISTRRKPSNG